jgi:hypothetical protein
MRIAQRTGCDTVSHGRSLILAWAAGVVVALYLLVDEALTLQGSRSLHTIFWQR